MFKNCNGTIKEASEGESSNMESVEDDEELLDEFDHDKPIGIVQRNEPLKIRTNSCKILVIFFGSNLVQNTLLPPPRKDHIRYVHMDSYRELHSIRRVK